MQEKDAEFANRHGFSRHKPALPLYTTTDADQALAQFRPVDFHEPFDLGDGARLLFRYAGHILGAATAEVRLAGETILFSGDLGRYDDPTMVDPELAGAADYLVVESTYGDRIHPTLDAAAALKEVIERTARRGGTVVIPAFAVGRTQSLLYELWTLKARGELELVPIYVDSPMAINATELFHKHRADHRLDPDVCRQMCDLPNYVRTTEGSKVLSASRMPKVIISASGMATGGRVLHHIKAFGIDPRNTILFAGFQAPGTRGRAMVDGMREVKIHGQWIDLRAEVADLTMLSAHADSNELMRWLGGFGSRPARTFIVHGEPGSSVALQQRVERELGWRCSVPRMNVSSQLDPMRARLTA